LGHRDPAPFAGGVNEAVERFRGVRGDGQEPDVVEDHEVGAQDAADRQHR
jgi:hypothetical protein